MYKIFGKYGPIRQIRLGDSKTTQGTAFLVYDDIYDACDAVRGMSGFNVGGRYVVVLYFQQARVKRDENMEGKKRKIEELKQEVAEAGGE